MKALRDKLDKGLAGLVVFLLVGLLSCALAPAATAAPGGPPAPPQTSASAGALSSQGFSGPFCRPGLTESVARGTLDHLKDLAGKLPPEMLPPALRKGDEGDGAGNLSQDAGGPAGGGTGGWTNMVRPYAPSPDPDVVYDAAREYSVIDTNGTLHFFYREGRRTDVSQGGDPPGTRFEYLWSQFYTSYSGDQWSAPVNLTPLAGFESTWPITWNVDADGFLHNVYGKHSWGKDAATGLYEGVNENIYYQYRSPDGTWSGTRQLSNFAGNYTAPLGNARTIGNRQYVMWYEVLNKETAPASYSATLCFVDGSKESWNAMAVLRQWDYTQAAGQLEPAGFPAYDASPLNGEVTATYDITTLGAAAIDNITDSYGIVRDPGGAWGTSTMLTAAAPTAHWYGGFASYDLGDNSCEFGFIELRGDNSTAAPPPGMNIYLARHTASGWMVMDNVTDAPLGDMAIGTTMVADPFSGLHTVFQRVKLVWDAGLTQWVPKGSQLLYTDNTSGTFSPPEVVQAYSDDHFYLFSQRVTALDGDGFTHTAFTRYKNVGGTSSEYQVFYSSNGPAAGGRRGGAFPSPYRVNADSTNTVKTLMLTLSPDGDPIVTWMESRMSGAIPEVGVILSRRRTSAVWRDIVTVSPVPGSSDIIHETGGGQRYYFLLGLLQGEQTCVFETAKYDPATATYSDFKKYCASTAAGAWSPPELVSSAAISGSPLLFADRNQRLFALFGVTDAATGKQMVYGTMQPGATPTACTYYFAEGTTRQQEGERFDEWISIQNPGAEDANVQITYMLGTGETKIQGLTVPKTSRVTVKVNDAVGPDQDVSAKVTSDAWIVAERPMYFEYRGWQGGHDAMGSISTSRVWFFAEGNTLDGFSEYLTIQNPSETSSNVKVTYMLGDGTTVDQLLTVGPHTRATVDPRAVVADGSDISMKVVSDSAIVCERPMYFDYQSFASGGHNVVGGLSPTKRWYFAEGTTRPGFDTFVCLQNPFAYAGTATVTYILGDGSTKTQEVAMAPTSRRTVKVNDAVGPDQDVAVVVDSTIPVLAERPMYFDYHGFAPGGHVSMGALFPMNAWFLAEGTTLPGFEEWLSLENPGEADATASITFMLGDGSTVARTAAVPAKTRVTIKVNDLVPAGQDVSTFVWCDRGIIVERPMYFTYQGGWAGGTDVLGFPPAYPPPLVFFILYG